MTLPALKSLKHLALGAVVASVALGAAASEAVAPAAPEAVVAASPNPFADRLTNVVVQTHEGKNVRFYDDLIKGKIVMINFMYTTCKGR